MSALVLLSLMAASMAEPVSSSSFADAAIAARGSGIAVVELFVSPGREVLDCTIVNSELSKLDNTRICDGLKGKQAGRAAVGPDGLPAYGSLIYVVAGSDAGQDGQLRPNLQADVELDVASLPGGAARKSVNLNVLLDASGKVASCEAAQGAPANFAKAACASIAQQRLRAHQGADGVPVAYVKTIAVEFVVRESGR